MSVHLLTIHHLLECAEFTDLQECSKFTYSRAHGFEEVKHCGFALYWDAVNLSFLALMCLFFRIILLPRHQKLAMTSGCNLKKDFCNLEE